jgi:hypothetical protein
MELNKNQQALNDYLEAGNKLIQTNNRLLMNGEVVNTKTFVSLMVKLYGGDWVLRMKDFVVIKD